MKNTITSIILLCSLFAASVSAATESNGSRDAKESQMIIKIGEKTFTAQLEDSRTAIAFKAMLPLTLNMDDVNANEKVISLPAKLPTNDANPGDIHAGDLMIWRSRSLVLFYKSFPTSYSYTKIGRINDATGLSSAVGAGNVTVKFELK